MALAEWMSSYYVTPLSKITFRMLPRGLLQRTRVVLHLAKTEVPLSGAGVAEQSASLRLQALIGLLLVDGLDEPPAPGEAGTQRRSSAAGDLPEPISPRGGRGLENRLGSASGGEGG